MKTLYCDIETYSETDLKKSGVYAYSEDPTFEILMCGWSVDEGPVEMVIGHAAVMKAIGPYLDDPSIVKVAANAQFERVCFSRALQFPVDGFLDPDQWEDPLPIAAEAGLPVSLEKLAEALGGEKKDSAGTRLINVFCKPKKDGTRMMPKDEPEKWDQFVEYCRQDVVTLVDTHRNLPDWPTEQEREVWIADQHINDFGIAVDLELAKLAVEADDENQAEHDAEMSELIEISNTNSVVQIRKALAKTGLELDDLRKDTIDRLLAGDDLDPTQRRVLELRKEMALVASKKYTAVLASVSRDERIRGSFRFFGAHTGRWSSRGIQLQNLPQAQMKYPEAAILDLRLGFGATGPQLKALVRSVLVGPFAVLDYSAIEARVLAWLAGEQWALDAFIANRDIYVETAERMGGLTRQQGKVAVLALGYQGGANSLRHMGAQGTEDELQQMKSQWRKANRRIVRFWRDFENAFADGGTAGRIEVRVDGVDRHAMLPSGRWITYRNVRWERWVIIDENTGLRVRKEGWRFDGRLGRADTYGGRLAENATQAVSRDILADAILQMHARGLKVCGHVHDEAILEGGQTVLDALAEIMNKPPVWAPDLPIKAEGFLTPRYRKG